MRLRRTLLMLPPGLPYRGRFSRTLIYFCSNVVSVGLKVSSEIPHILLQAFGDIRKRIRVFRSSTCLDLIEDIIGVNGFLYLSEAVVTGEFVFLLIMLCISRRGVPRQDLEFLSHNRVFLDTIDSNMPHVLRWYQTINKFNLKRRILDCIDIFKSSPSILERTPAEATRRHSEEIARGLWRHPPATGVVRLHFFHAYHGQRHDVSHSCLFQHPDVRIDLYFDSIHGIDLGKARKLLGVEKLSVITGLSPYRATFDPFDRDQLSPLAVYDLSKQLCEPIRVFEPCPSIVTKIKRKIHDGISLSAYLTFTLLRCCLGFTLHDHFYLAATFGDTFAARTMQLSRFIHPLNAWVLEGVRLIAQLCFCQVLLLLMILFKAAGVVRSCLSFTIHTALALLVFLLVTVRDIVSSLLCLPLKALIIIVVFSWITLADFLINSRNS